MDLDGANLFPSWCVCVDGCRVAYIKVGVQLDVSYTTDGRDYKVCPSLDHFRVMGEDVKNV